METTEDDKNNKNNNGKLNHLGKLHNFEVLQFIGVGGFSKVNLALKRQSNTYYALKQLKKKKIERCQEVIHTINERNILSGFHHPFIVKLHSCFQSDENIYMVLDLITGGDLAYNLRSQGLFSEERVQFYAAQLVLVIDFLHENGIVYRDLKPENLLLNEKGYLILCDFGISKPNMRGPDARTDTFCGTEKYYSPEMIRGEKYGTAVDWWQLGTLLYQILCGYLPFDNSCTGIMLQNIVSAPLVFPEGVNPNTQDIISKFLIRNPVERLQDINQIKQHPYFTGIDWDQLERQELPAPYIPEPINPEDINFIDPSEIAESDEEEYEGGFISNHVGNHWEGFDYESSNNSS